MAESDALDNMPQQGVPPEGSTGAGQGAPGAAAADPAVPAPGAVDLPPGLTAHAVLEMCKSWDKQHETWFEPFRKVIEARHMAYRSQVAKTPDSHNVLFMPVSNSVVETATARVLPGLIQKRKLAEALPDNAEPDTDFIKDTEDFTNQEVMFNRGGGLPHVVKMVHAVKGAIIEGTMILKTRWCVESYNRKGWKTVKHPETGQLVTTEPQSTTQTQEYATFDPASILDMAWDPAVSWAIQDSPWKREKHKKSLHELFIMQQNGELQDVEKLADIVPAAVKDSGQAKDYEDKRKELLTGARNHDPNGDNKFYGLKEWWGWISWKDPEGRWQHKKFWWFIAEDQLLVSFRENPLDLDEDPYGSCPFRVNPREMLGGDVLEPIDDLQDLINTVSGRFVDMIEKAADTPLLYDRRSGLKGRSTVIRQRGMIPVQSVEGVKPLPVDTAAIGVTSDFVDKMVDFSRKSTPATELAQGIDQGGETTATEASILQRGAGAQFSVVIEVMQWCMSAWLCRKFYLLWRQFGKPDQMWLRSSSVDGQPKLLDKARLQATNYRWAPVGFQTGVDKPQRLKELQVAVDQMVKYADSFMRITKKRPRPDKLYIEEVLPLMDVKNGSTYFEDLAPEEVMAMSMGMAGPGAAPAAPTPRPVAGAAPRILPSDGALARPPAADVPTPETGAQA